MLLSCLCNCRSYDLQCRVSKLYYYTVFFRKIVFLKDILYLCRSEIAYLTGLLRSRAAVEFSSSVGPKRSEGGAPAFERHQSFASSPSEEHMHVGVGDRSLRVMSSPIINSRVS